MKIEHAPVDNSFAIEEFQKMLKDDLVRIANVESGRYFVHRDGKVISMTTAFPRYVAPIQKVSGEYFIILYTPHLKAYDLAQLVLSTFQKKNEDDLDYIFKNGDMSNCNLINLSWADREKAHASRQLASNKYIQIQMNETKEKELAKTPSKAEPEHGYFELPIAIVDSCIVNKQNFRGFMQNFCDSLNSYLHTHHVKEDDHYLIRSTVTTLEHMITLIDLPINALKHIIATPPKAQGVKIIYEQAQNRLKGQLGE